MDWHARRGALEQHELETEWELYREGSGGTIFDEEPERPRLLGWMEEEFWEIDRSESGQLSRICMDHALRERGFESPETRRVLRDLFRSMNGVILDHRKKKLEAMRRGSARH